jgi:outer membrane protein assembly factor BamB
MVTFCLGLILFSSLVSSINYEIFKNDKDQNNYSLFLSSNKGKTKYYSIEYLNTNKENNIDENIIHKNNNSIYSMNYSWPMYCHDKKHTSRSPFSTEKNPNVIKWKYTTLNNDWIEDTPVISNDGTIYFGASWDFYSIKPNGTFNWMIETGNLISGSSPAIDENGIIFFGNWGGTLFAVNPNGTLKWQFNAKGSIATSPVIAYETIYFGTNNNRFWAVNSNGTEKWNFTTGGAIFSSPAIADTGEIYFGCCDDYFYSLFPNGTLHWRFKTGDEIHGDPSIADDGTIYFGSYDNFLYALNQNGTLRWKVNIGSGPQSNPSLASDGTIYVGSDKFYALDANGTIKWIFNLGYLRWIAFSSSAISYDGTIYVGTNIGDAGGGEILALHPNGTEFWRKNIANKWVDSSPSIAPDGTIYIGCAYDISTGYLYAIGRGPLNIDANGPYQGHVGVPVQFTGTLLGGIPPYTCHWDFGDGTTSIQQNPTHNYTDAGNYTATFTVTDTTGNYSSDTATVTITYATPTVTITKPVNGIYLNNIKILPFPRPLIIGPITIEATATQIPFGIDHVTFSINNRVRYTDNEAPYTWTWSTPSLFRHTITVTAYDKSGKSTSVSIVVSKFF